MFKLDNDFLTSLGLGSLPVEEKNKLLQHIYERLEMNVGMRLAEKMTDAQLDEFEGFIDRNDEAGALRWLETNFPNYKDVVAEELEKLKTEVSQAAPQILSAAQNAAVTPVNPNPQPAQPVEFNPPAPQQSVSHEPYQAPEQQSAAPQPFQQPPTDPYSAQQPSPQFPPAQQSVPTPDPYAPGAFPQDQPTPQPLAPTGANYPTSTQFPPQNPAPAGFPPANNSGYNQQQAPQDPNPQGWPPANQQQPPSQQPGFPPSQPDAGQAPPAADYQQPPAGQPPAGFPPAY